MEHFNSNNKTTQIHGQYKRFKLPLLNDSNISLTTKRVRRKERSSFKYDDDDFIYYDDDKHYNQRLKSIKLDLDDDKLKHSKVDLCKRYDGNTETISQINSMTDQERKIYEFLNKVTKDEEHLKLPKIESNFSRCKNANIRVYKQYKPYLEKWHKLNCKETQDVSTQTNEFQSYLLPLWKITANLSKENRKVRQQNELILKPLHNVKQQEYSIKYDAYDYKKCQYLRINSNNMDV